MITIEEQLEEKQTMIEEMEDAVQNGIEIVVDPAPSSDDMVIQEVDVSSKLETRIDYITHIKKLCEKRHIKPPKGLVRMKLSQLKQELANTINESCNEAFHLGSTQKEQEYKESGEQEEKQRIAFMETRAVNTLYRIDMILLTLISQMSERYKTYFNGKYIDNAQKRFEESEVRREELKEALRALYMEESVKQFIDQYCNPVVQVILINLGAMAASISDGKVTLEEKFKERIHEVQETVEKLEKKTVTI